MGRGVLLPPAFHIRKDIGQSGSELQRVLDRKLLAACSAQDLRNLIEGIDSAKARAEVLEAGIVNIGRAKRLNVRPLGE